MIKLMIKLVVFMMLTSSAQATVSSELLKKAWFVLPWEEFKENPDQIHFPVTLQQLIKIRKNLPKQMGDGRVKRALNKAVNEVLLSSTSEFFPSGKKAYVSELIDFPLNTDLTCTLQYALKMYIGKNNGNIPPVDFFWVHVKVFPQRSAKTVCIAIPRIDIASTCLYCCAMSCFTGYMAITCWVCGQALSQALLS